MLLSTDLNPTGDYTQVLNDIIFDDRLTHAEFRFWCKLLSLPKGQKFAKLDSGELAKEMGMVPRSCREFRQSLKTKGFLIEKRDELIVTIPSEEFEVKEVKLTPEQQLANDLRDIWNECKPEPFSRQRKGFSAAQIDTLQQHVKHNDAKDVKAFLKKVLEGCKADAWWSEKVLNFTNVFGSGSPKQNKFTNIEKLYKLSNSKEGRAKIWDINDDQCWLDWYQSLNQDYDKVERITVKEYEESIDHQWDHDGDKTIYIYLDTDGLVISWTKKARVGSLRYLPTAK